MQVRFNDGQYSWKAVCHCCCCGKQLADSSCFSRRKPQLAKTITNVVTCQYKYSIIYLSSFFFCFSETWRFFAVQPSFVLIILGPDLAKNNRHELVARYGQSDTSDSDLPFSPRTPQISHWKLNCTTKAVSDEPKPIWLRKSPTEMDVIAQPYCPYWSSVVSSFRPFCRRTNLF